MADKIVLNHIDYLVIIVYATFDNKQSADQPLGARTIMQSTSYPP